ncbi:MAG TPA: hypothetical protein V6C58_17485 [Allocoleopsis sp.]
MSAYDTLEKFCDYAKIDKTLIKSFFKKNIKVFVSGNCYSIYWFNDPRDVGIGLFFGNSILNMKTDLHSFLESSNLGVNLNNFKGQNADLAGILVALLYLENYLKNGAMIVIVSRFSYLNKLHEMCEYLLLYGDIQAYGETGIDYQILSEIAVIVTKYKSKISFSYSEKRKTIYDYSDDYGLEKACKLSLDI